MSITHATDLRPAPDTADLAAAAMLQRVLPGLVALSLDAKQAHWNVTGENFLTIHALTDEIADDARAWADRVAERAVALGVSVDARPGTVASVAGRFPAGRVTDREVVLELSAGIGRLAATTRAAVDSLADVDPVSQDVTIAVLEGLEKHRWMLDAHAY
jgi:starvation-inducible DNA-binding protein